MSSVILRAESKAGQISVRACWDGWPSLNLRLGIDIYCACDDEDLDLESPAAKQILGGHLVVRIPTDRSDFADRITEDPLLLVGKPRTRMRVPDRLSSTSSRMLLLRADHRGLSGAGGGRHSAALLYASTRMDRRQAPLVEHEDLFDREWRGLA